MVTSPLVLSIIVSLFAVQAVQSGKDPGVSWNGKWSRVKIRFLHFIILKDASLAPIFSGPEIDLLCFYLQVRNGKLNYEKSCCTHWTFFPFDQHCSVSQPQGPSPLTLLPSLLLGYRIINLTNEMLTEDIIAKVGSCYQTPLKSFPSFAQKKGSSSRMIPQLWTQHEDYFAESRGFRVHLRLKMQADCQWWYRAPPQIMKSYIFSYLSCSRELEAVPLLGYGRISSLAVPMGYKDLWGSLTYIPACILNMCLALRTAARVMGNQYTVSSQWPRQLMKHHRRNINEE